LGWGGVTDPKCGERRYTENTEKAKSYSGKEIASQTPAQALQ
jgi:hypothetical protein